jgi:hypothetical protein
MGDKQDKHSSVGKSFKIDQRAVKVFLDWVPDNWLPRKQDPDFYIDYLVEIVENGEPTGKHFGVQIKGYEDCTKKTKPLSYSFKTKHLKYYLRSQHPVFLFRVNVTTREGYWLFSQKYLKEKVPRQGLDQQKNLTIQFTADDSLFNDAKFRCLLPEAERFVRDLHPGSPRAALSKREAELESLDPRCSVSISIENGKEHIAVVSNEDFSFTAKINHQGEKKWQRLLERGEKIKVKREHLEFIGAPILQEALKNVEGEFEIEYGKEIPGSVHVISKTEPGKVIPIDGKFRSGTKVFSFRGGFPDSPLSICYETSWDAAFKAKPFNFSLSFKPKNWIGQPILSLAYFDQTASFANAFSGTQGPEIEIFIQGNSLQKGVLSNGNGDIARGIRYVIDWFCRCRWLANHFKINPLFPPFEKLGRKQMDALDRLYVLFTQQGTAVSSPNIQIEFSSDRIVSEDIIASSDKVLRMEKPAQTFNFMGTPVTLDPIQHIFTEVEIISQTKLNDGTVKVVFSGTKNTTRTSSFIQK